MVAAAADEEYDEAFAVFPVSTDPVSGGRCLPEHQQEHLGQTAPTIVCTLVLKSTPVFQTYTDGLLST